MKLQYAGLSGLLGVGLIMLAGCSVNPYEQRSPAPVRDVTGTTDTWTSTTEQWGSRSAEQGQTSDSDLPAIVALIDDAETAQQNGDLDTAADNLERALRIQPRNADLWYRLASLRLAQQQSRQAEDMAKKSISLARGDDELLRLNWRLIAAARLQAGDENGAREAREKAENY